MVPQWGQLAVLLHSLAKESYTDSPRMKHLTSEYLEFDSLAG